MLEDEYNDVVTSYKDSIVANIGHNGVVILTNLIPKMAELFGDNASEGDQIVSPADTKSALVRLKTVFLGELLQCWLICIMLYYKLILANLNILISVHSIDFVKTICTQRPVCLQLDDLQWADPVSLDLISLLVTDISLYNFMIVGTYRDNNEEDMSSLLKTLTTIKDQGKAYSTIQLDNLTLDNVSDIASSSLSLEKDQVGDLANALYESTLGNPFYVQTSLQMLKRKKMLAVSPLTSKWTWDIDKVTNELLLSSKLFCSCTYVIFVMYCLS